MYKFGISFVIVGSIYYLLTGLWKLYLYRRFKELLFTFLIVFGGFALIYFLISVGSKKPTGNQRLWFGAPGAFLIPIWILSGFFVKGYVDKILYSSPSCRKYIEHKKILRTRIIGWILLIISISIWIYGVIYPLSNLFFIGCGMILCLLCLLFGLSNIIKGTNLDV